MPKEIDEDLIEATIRRVAESAARASVPPIEMPVADAVGPVFAGSAEEASAAASEPAATPATSVDQDDEDLPITPIARRGLPRRAAPAPAPAPAPEWSPPPPAVAPDEVLAQLREITRRLDAMQAALETIARQEAESGGEWELAPRPHNPIVMPQRPAIVRQPVASGDADVIDTRPLPKPLPPLVEPKRGFDLLPRTYRITIEDKRRGVDLVPLHRAMLGMKDVRDLSLLSYTNGTAIVALETDDELDPENVRLAMQQAMQRDARVEVHNENTMVVKLTPED